MQRKDIYTDKKEATGFSEKELEPIKSTRRRGKELGYLERGSTMDSSVAMVGQGSTETVYENVLR